MRRLRRLIALDHGYAWASMTNSDVRCLAVSECGTRLFQKPRDKPAKKPAAAEIGPPHIFVTFLRG